MSCRKITLQCLVAHSGHLCYQCMVQIYHSLAVENGIDCLTGFSILEARGHGTLLLPQNAQNFILSKVVWFCDRCWWLFWVNLDLALWHCPSKFPQVYSGFHSRFSFHWTRKAISAVHALYLEGFLKCLTRENKYDSNTRTLKHQWHIEK